MYSSHSAWTPNFGKASHAPWRHRPLVQLSNERVQVKPFYFGEYMDAQEDGEIKKCRCGCGKVLTPNYIGKVANYCHGHYDKSKRPKPTGKSHLCNGYVMIYAPWHKRSNKNGYYMEHVIIVERAIGKQVSDGVEVHHVNSIRSDNRPQNLVVCPDGAYHQLLHRRHRALEACGDPAKIKCTICKQWSDAADLDVYKSAAFHKACLKEKYQQRKEENERTKSA